MGIALSDSESGGRSKLTSAAFTAIGLVFFFGVGLAGGAAYKIYFSEDGPLQTAAQTSPPAGPAAPEPALANASPSPAESTAEKAAPPEPAPVEAAATPSPEPQAAPTPGEASEPAMMAQAAPSAATTAPELTPQPAAEASASLEAAIAPVQPAAEAPAATLVPPSAAIPAKPEIAAKRHRDAPQAAALHAPAASRGSAAGRFHVQFGAFASEDNARRVQSAIEAAGLRVEIRHEPGPSGNPLFFIRSPSYADRAAAVSAAQNVQNRAKHLPNPVAIDYAIIPDRAAGEQHAQR
jgi:hypothetical protein